MNNIYTELFCRKLPENIINNNSKQKIKFTITELILEESSGCSEEILHINFPLFALRQESFPSTVLIKIRDLRIKYLKYIYIHRESEMA